MLKSLLRRLRPSVAPVTLPSVAAYERWAASYPPYAHNVLMQAEEAAMLRLCPPLGGMRVLDLACGSGRYTQIALQQGAASAVGFDNSPPMLRVNPHAAKAVSTTEAIPLASASVDVMLCGLALGHLPALDASLSEIGRVLKQGGHALVSDFHPFIFLNGQRRTFTDAAGKTFAVEHHVHLYADYHAAAEKAGLVIDGVLEPRLGQDASVRFQDDDARLGTPVVIVYRFRKARRLFVRAFDEDVCADDGRDDGWWDAQRRE
ncbi:MAG: class I SAM-dependent methyltransferase [Chloroflexi bacterium]|nr:class I SAM-dependent methyltransferase [Chloroflexota bacterium]MCC6891806.1 class I SAM-dependent methyltransferase [Anaerolineae bacterium]